MKKWFNVFGFKKGGNFYTVVKFILREDEVGFFFDNNIRGYDYLKIGEYDWREERDIHRKVWERENEGKEYPYIFEEGDDPLDLNSEMANPHKFIEKYGERFENK